MAGRMAKSVLTRVDAPTRKRLVKAEATTDPKFGKTPAERTPDELLRMGVVNLDKPSGPTSHQVASWVALITGADPVGHGGTLDPRVTGVLPVGLGEATKGVRALLTAGKEYVTLLRLHTDVPENRVREAAKQFVGKVKQLPPVRSAVARRVRQREIYYLDVHEVKGRDILFTVGCEAGTYVRNLCIDIARALNTRGHMQQLLRTRTGPFHLDDTVTLQDLADGVAFWKEDANEKELRRVVRPMESLFSHLPKIVVRDSAIGAICHGAPLAVPGVSAVDSDVEPGRPVLIESLKGEAVAYAVAEMPGRTIVEKETGVAARPERIMMPKDTYPKVWKRD